MPRNNQFFLSLMAACLWQGMAVAEESFTFSFAPPREGTETIQDAQFNLFLRFTGPSDPTATKPRDQNVDRRQRKAVRVLAVDGRRATKVSVRYDVAQQSVSTGAESGSFKLPGAGKGYVVERVNDEIEVTREDGSTPSEQEIEFVRGSMSAIGEVNPLGEFLNGRRIAVNDSVELPPEVATALLGMSEALGSQPCQVTMTLVGEKIVGEARCGEFAVKIQVRPRPGDGLSMFIQGKMWVQIETCRTVAAEISGPVGVFPSVDEAGASTGESATGRIRVAVRTQSASAAPNLAGRPRVVR